ncbi:Arginine transport system permease protein ArtQ [Gemella morbillorum]|jgi:amino ABC transporter, permease protein, 3-TM region, his/glu/gln/arg/opine family|uniref:ABC transporter permease subunit n=1 Tax=Gemella morbillorum TaxID=29391 RepID=A0A2X4N4Y7_9BACL|nr:amino acid ABC transporter permease [Gemella morbillorum]EFV36296.1 His/Glu/Gln/Arg/opine family amino ABC transporter [Gemella morbillorum M424]MDK8239379.1 amino acid ABC transporter permease [Gemella morbillorum]MDK8255427.1 amino acid ABC transporter permease [Gemella morbillorum]QGS09266.1 ABC transporter permease subunit [Gemella morbillorum]UBH80221.1 amino acid ABC transporter permease [Gemella morbillorum]
MFDFLPKYYTTYIDATVTTLKVSLIALLIGLLLGIVICLAKISTIKVLNVLATIYVEVIRNTPILVQIMIIYFALPEVGISFTPFMSAIIALSINSGAYVSEIFRSGILAIDKGQMEAGRSLGLSYFQTMKFIILPQALKNSLPALGNEFISLVKESSIVYFVGVADIMFAANTVKNATYETFGPYLIAAAIYFIITSVLSFLVKRLEKKLAK